MVVNDKVKKNTAYCWVLVVLLAGSLLAACHPAGGDTNLANSSENVTITFADFSAFRGQYQALIDDFEAQNPTIEVQFVPIDEAASASTLDFAGLASLADVLALPAQPQGPDVPKFMDLQPVLESDRDFDPAVFWPGSLEGCRVEGLLIGLPLSVQPLLVMYDGSAFDAAGLARPAPGWSWQDFEQGARQLAGSKGGITRYGFVDSGRPVALLAPMLANTLVGQGGAYDVAALSQTLDWYVSLARDGVIPTDLQPGGLGDLVSSGQAAMWLDTLSFLTQRRASLGQEIGLAPFPETADGDTAQTTQAWARCALVSAGTAHPQAAWAWLQFLAAHPAPSMGPGAIPARIDVAETSSTWLGLDEETANVVRYALNHAWYGSNSSEPFSAINDALTRAMAGDLPLAQALASSQAGVEPASTEPSEITPIVVATPRPTSPPATPPAGAVTIDFFVDSYYSASLETLEPLAEAFHQEHPDILVNLIDQQNSGLKYVNQESVAEKFDCFASWTGVFSGSIQYLDSLEPLIDTDIEGQAIRADIPDSLQASDQVNGELYGLPVASRAAVMYYNQDIFARAGLQPPALDWTLDDFWMLASSAAGDGNYGFVPLIGREFFDFLLSKYEISLYDFTSSTPVINFEDPEVINTVSQQADMAANKVIPAVKDPVDYRKGNATQRYGLVENGKTAMWINEAGLADGFFTPPEGASFGVGVVPLPATGAPLPSETSGASLYISSKAENPAACWEWIKFLSTHPEAFLGIPVRQSILQSPQYATAIGPQKAEVYQLVNAQPHQEQSSNYVEKYPSYPLYVWWPDALASVFDGVSPTQAMSEITAKAQAYLDCITVVADPNQENVWLDCALQADPEFKVPQDH